MMLYICICICICTCEQQKKEHIFASNRCPVFLSLFFWAYIGLFFVALTNEAFNNGSAKRVFAYSIPRAMFGRDEIFKGFLGIARVDPSALEMCFLLFCANTSHTHTLPRFLLSWYIGVRFLMFLERCAQLFFLHSFLVFCLWSVSDRFCFCCKSSSSRPASKRCSREISLV